MQRELFFQYCQKLVVLSDDLQKVLLARRQGEADYDSTYSFIGGKMETTDASILAGMQREKDEEVGPGVKLKVIPGESYNVLYRKKDGSSVILPHIAALFVSGKIALNKEEYSEYQWVPLADLAALEPKIENVPEMTRWAVAKLAVADPAQLVEI